MNIDVGKRAIDYPVFIRSPFYREKVQQEILGTHFLAEWNVHAIVRAASDGCCASKHRI